MTRRAIFASALVSVGLVVAPVLTGHGPRFIWNASASAPIGLYAVEPADPIEVTDLVAVQPPDALAELLEARRYLRAMFDRYGNVAAMLAAYNAGPGRYDEYLSAGRVLPAETRAYVAKLAPILGDATPSHGASMPAARPPDWREAPLFVARSGNRQSVIGDAPAPPDGNTRIPVPDATGAPDRRQHEAIFVTRADSGATP